ncbi:hypothetical protein [Nostoc sp. CHAB 5836]|uniref:hypothetical protein n=1 Tax=Nostoc sp. CHAB 5836 TaxID=2780404 RepID=UPI001E430D14|nr:hypothetical protein [Nostoc sp. CHAB 5836]
MIITVGDSRVGKSTVTKLLIDLFQYQVKRIKVYNHDNRQRLKAYERVVKIETLDFFRDDTDKMLNNFNDDQLDIILVDMPGQYIDKTCQYIVQSDLFDLLREYEWKLTFLQPISHRKDCVNSLDKLIKFATNNANYVVAKNHYFDTRFSEYQESIQTKFHQIGGTEIELSALHRDHYEALERTSKPYSLCYTDTSIYLVYRSYIYYWIKNFNNSVLSNNTAIQYLGL